MDIGLKLKELKKAVNESRPLCGYNTTYRGVVIQVLLYREKIKAGVKLGAIPNAPHRCFAL